ncbi:PREDICTED: class I heat shock protein-like [Nicotiana attenuata]|uniref:17.6 kDa class i heat shock protein n=1 Tax=Nicotiana attenuata TaxID=49451 RepID=A0A1J6IKM1_NICAT|nr:PREDICTED: class I heat shock protein-like [Nicotiana attenuata]OIT01080.1 17.6 kda class i heat shock protein [Nicotiana attenuata]
MALIPQLLDDIFQPFSLIGSTNETSKFSNPRVDWKETQEAHVFKADLPGLKKEEVKVEVEEGRVLQISGEIGAADKEDQKKENETWRRIERPRGKFCRKFWLPENAKLDEVKACMENGVLTVTIPKQEIKKPEVKTIEITG